MLGVHRHLFMGPGGTGSWKANMVTVYGRSVGSVYAMLVALLSCSHGAARGLERDLQPGPFVL